MNTIFRSSTGYVLFPVLFLIFFQFIGAALTLFWLPFLWLLSLAAMSALVVSGFITYRINAVFTITIQQALLVLGLSVGNTFLFLLRINWHIFDYICPTGLLGLVTEVAGGRFPVSFLSFPEFPMNYHQGFIFITGTLSYVSSLLPSLAIKASLVTLFLLLNVAIMLFFIAYENRYYYLPPLLFIFASSLSALFYTGLDLGWYNYLNIFEYSSSNSWPLAFLLLTVFFFFTKQYSHTASNILIGAALILAMSTINAAAFMVMILGTALIFAYHTYCTQRLSYQHLALSLGALILICILPRFIPSAFLAGPMYDTPQYGIRLLESGVIKYLKHMARYLLLTGPLIFLALFISFHVIKDRVFDWRSWPIALLIVSFFFPFVFILTNIDLWDNLHKFSVLAIFTAIVVVVSSLDSGYMKRLYIIGYLLLCALLSLPALYDITTVRLSFNHASYIYPTEDTAAVVNYLHDKHVMLLPYKTDIAGQCDAGGYTDIALRSGNFLYDSYFVNFLLAPTLEETYADSADWVTSPQKTRARLAQLEAGTVVLVQPDYAEEFLAITTELNDSARRVIHINNYLIYE